MPDFDLTSTIEDAIADSTVVESADSTTVESADFSADTASGLTDTSTVESADAEAVAPASAEVASPGARSQAAPQEQPGFDKKLGMAPSINGRENRLPYSRVKKIVEKAELDAAKPHLARLAELEPKIAEYEAQLGKVAEFEHVMLNDGPKFMQMLAQLPQYQGFFEAIQELQAKANGTSLPTGEAQAAPVDEMPQPDDLVNGTYTMEGLKKLLDWQARQVEAKVSQKYQPIEQAYQAQEQERAQRAKIEAVIPQVEAQIQDARTWPQFTENEDEIVKILQQYPTASLETAYRHVVFPKLQVSRDQMRSSILQELGKAPRSTSAPTGASRQVTEVPKGPQTLEDVIAAQVAGLKGR